VLGLEGKTETNYMGSISEGSTRVIQLVNLLILLLFLLIAIGFSILKGSIGIGLKIFLIGMVFWGPVFLLYLKLFEVRLVQGEILIANLFVRHQFKKTDFEDIHPTFFPLIYKISFKGSERYFFFMIPMENVFTILFVDRTLIVERMKSLVKE
jgi:hypothetical protein